MANKIQIKRGLESNINKSNLSQGELAVTTDSNKLYVGTSKGPIQLNKDDESLVTIDYYEADDSKKEKIKSLFLKEDGSISEHQLVKPSILLAPTIEPTDQTSTYTIGQYVCGFGDTESKIIEPTGKQITKYTLTFTSMAIDGGIYLTYNVSEDTLTYKWVKSPVIQSDYNQNDEKAADYIKNRAIYEDGRVIYNGKVTFSDGSATITAPETLSNMLSSTPFLNEKGEFILEMVVSIGGQEMSLYSDGIGIQKYGPVDQLYNEYICSIRNFRMSIIYDKNLLQFTQIRISNPEITAEVEVNCNIKIGVVSNVIKNWIVSYNMPN